MPRAIRLFAAAAVVLLLALGGVFVWYQRQVNPPGAPGERVTVVIPQGAAQSTIAAVLDDKGVISSARVFRIYLRLHPADLKAGMYTFRTRSSMGDVVAALDAGPKTVYHRLTVPEGLTLTQIAERVGKLPGKSTEAFLAAAASGRVRSQFQPSSVSTLEGLIFPDTYFVEEKHTEEQILTRMVEKFDEVATKEGLGQGQHGLTPYQTLVLASLVESEGKVAAERPKIAQVIYNRIDAGMLLQIDATVIYARGGRRPDGRVLFRDLEIQSPYNTYRVKGLPPTPISATGRAAIRAALNPEPGPWLFYVKYQKDGTHKFSTTLAEHNAAIADAKRRGVNP